MLQFVTTLQGHRNWVRSAVFSPDGRLAVSGGDDHTVRLSDTRTKRCTRIYNDPSDRLNKVGFLIDGQCVASAGSYQLYLGGSMDIVVLATVRGHFTFCAQEEMASSKYGTCALTSSCSSTLLIMGP